MSSITSTPFSSLPEALRKDIENFEKNRQEQHDLGKKLKDVEEPQSAQVKEQAASLQQKIQGLSQKVVQRRELCNRFGEDVSKQVQIKREIDGMVAGTLKPGPYGSTFFKGLAQDIEKRVEEVRQQIDGLAQILASLERGHSTTPAMLEETMRYQAQSLLQCASAVALVHDQADRLRATYLQTFQKPDEPNPFLPQKPVPPPMPLYTAFPQQQQQQQQQPQQPTAQQPAQTAFPSFQTAPAAQPTAPAAPTGFSFGAPAPAAAPATAFSFPTATTTTAAPAPATTSLFGAPAAPTTTAAPTSTFGFATPAAPAATAAPTGFGFPTPAPATTLATPAAPAPATGGFSFGTPSAFPTPAANLFGTTPAATTTTTTARSTSTGRRTKR